jgi:hypothetical protein
MNMEMDTMGIHSAGAKITFEVYVHKFWRTPKVLGW